MRSTSARRRAPGRARTRDAPPKTLASPGATHKERVSTIPRPSPYASTAGGKSVWADSRPPDHPKSPSRAEAAWHEIPEMPSLRTTGFISSVSNRAAAPVVVPGRCRRRGKSGRGAGCWAVARDAFLPVPPVRRPEVRSRFVLPWNEFLVLIHRIMGRVRWFCEWPLSRPHLVQGNLLLVITL